jgi:hypothetical protein
MKPHRLIPAVLATIIGLTACADSPVAPASGEFSRTTTSPSFARGGANDSYTFTQLDVPGAQQTFPSGINAGGKVVGWYTQGGITRGFIFDAGTFTTVVYPGALVTQLRGVGPGGEIVGSYRTALDAPVNAHGFILTTAGEFIPVNYPGHINTVAQRILPDGTILGCYHDTDQGATMHGMSSSKDGFSAISVAMSMTNGGTPSGRKVAGFFTDMTAGRGRAFVLEGEEFTPFDAPNSASTAAWDMGPSGTVVGLFADAAPPHATHGFVLERGGFTTINFPNSAYTDVFGTNASGDLVGKYRLTPTGVNHGYVATRSGEE